MKNTGSEQGIHSTSKWHQRVSAVSCHSAGPQRVLGPLIQSREGRQFGQWVPAGVSNGLDRSASSSPKDSARSFPSGITCTHGFYLKESGFHGPGLHFNKYLLSIYNVSGTVIGT